MCWKFFLEDSTGVISDNSPFTKNLLGCEWPLHTQLVQPFS